MKTCAGFLVAALAVPVVGVIGWKIWPRNNELMEEARRQAGTPLGAGPHW